MSTLRWRNRGQPQRGPGPDGRTRRACLRIRPANLAGLPHDHHRDPAPLTQRTIGIPAVMSMEPADADLDRLRDLCADLAAATDGELLAWAGPGDADALMSRMWEVDELTMFELLASLCASTRSNRPRRPRLRRGYQADPDDIFAEMASLPRPGTRWCTNTDLTTWNPITQHTFDAIVVGAGNGVIVSVIAFEGGDVRTPDKWSRDRLTASRYPDSAGSS
jgi:hypothetical protein